MHILNMTDGEVESLAARASSLAPEGERKFGQFLEDFDAATELATSITENLTEGAELEEEKILVVVKTRIREKAEEFKHPLAEFDDADHPIQNKKQLGEYNALMEDFAGIVYTAIEDKGYKIKYSE